MFDSPPFGFAILDLGPVTIVAPFPSFSSLSHNLLLVLGRDGGT
jgi:hypothetical protein